MHCDWLINLCLATYNIARSLICNISFFRFLQVKSYYLFITFILSIILWWTTRLINKNASFFVSCKYSQKLINVKKIDLRLFFIFF